MRRPLLFPCTLAVVAALATSTTPAYAHGDLGPNQVNLVPTVPYGSLADSATTAPSGKAIAALPTTVAASAGRSIKAGAAIVDSTWKVGAGAGQYASSGASIGTHYVDPSQLSGRRIPSYGIQSRSTARALVVEGTEGNRVALVSNNLYIPQDLVNQRVSTILKDHDRQVSLGLKSGPVTGITDENMMIAVSHSHSSPYYSSMSWGLFAFQDVFDLRFFEYIAQQMAASVIGAVSQLKPARMGAITVPYDHTQKHSFGPATGDDGTPAGYPRRDGDLAIGVLRFDDISNPAAPKPLANLFTLGQHPEFLNGNNLLTGEFVEASMHLADAGTGAISLFAQNNTGTAEADKEGQTHAPVVRAEFDHREYAQIERGARQIANAVIGGFNAIGTANPSLVTTTTTPLSAIPYVPYAQDFPVKMIDRQFAPPTSHPYPSVSNCRTHAVVEGNPGIPVAGLPDCDRSAGALFGPLVGALEGTPLDPGVTYDELKEAGVPIPENYSAPSYTGLQETFQVHLQAIRLGEVLVTVCPCEQWADQSRNIKSRADKVVDNMWLGWDWTEFCAQDGGGPTAPWTCPHPGAVSRWNENPASPPPGGTLRIPHSKYLLIHAQVTNDAAGWDDPTNAGQAEAEPADPALIKGNYTHTELAPQHGYDMVMTIGMANDYWGYIATYREYQRGDHYRKALTGFGPHSSDFLATRLVAMGGAMKGDPVSTALIQYGPLDTAYMVDGVQQEVRAELIGRDAQVYLAAYDRTLPAEQQPAEILLQPQSITRFDVAQMTWRGGSNYDDDPKVRVERLVGGQWVTAGDMYGDIAVTIDFPNGPTDLHKAKLGQWDWKWTAHFEAFSSDIDTARGNQTPAGTYRYVVDGLRREGIPAAVASYRLVSDTFDVRPWDGIRVTDPRVDSGGRVSFAVGAAETKQFSSRYPAEGPTTAVTVGPIDYPDSWPTAKLPTTPETSGFTEELETRVTDMFPRLERTLVAGEYRYCFSCTYRPWADTGTVASVAIEVTGMDGRKRVVAGQNAGGGRWRTGQRLTRGETARVAPGGVRDNFGETNGASSAVAVVGSPSGGGGFLPAAPTGTSKASTHSDAKGTTASAVPLSRRAASLPITGLALLVLVVGVPVAVRRRLARRVP